MKKRLAMSKSPAVEWCFMTADTSGGFLELSSIAAKLEPLDGQLFADFVEAGDTKVLAFEEFVARLA